MAGAARLEGIDALRGIAALCVVGLHAHAVYPTYPNWFGKGYLGVDFFLMLSGYLMARITEPRLAAGLAPLSFMAARYRRFWPTVTKGSLIGIPYLWLRVGARPELFAAAFAANLAFIPWPADHLIFPLNVPVWTILAELLANLVHVLVLRHLSLRALVLLSALLFAATGFIAQDYGSLDVGARPSNVILAPPRVLLAYCLGIVLWRWKREELRLPIPASLVLAAMPVAILGSWALDWTAWPFDLAFVTLLCPAIIAGALAMRHGGALARFSGEIAFPLFAVHVPVLEAMKLAGFTVVAAVPAALGMAVAILWWTKRPARSMEPARN